MKLLLADSNEAFSRHLRGELLRSGALLCDLELAGSFARAAEQLSAEHFDAVLIDPFSLDDAPACVYSELQQLAPRAPVLVLCDATDDTLAIDAVRRGADDFLSKCHSQPEWLLRRVRFAIDRQRGEAARALLGESRTARETPAREPQFRGAAETISASVGLAAGVGASHESGATSNKPAGGEDRVGRGPWSAESSKQHAWRVLQIEADPVFFTLAEKLLRCESPYPLEVTRAGHLAEARRRLQSDVYDAVLLDLALPDSSGLDTLAAILPLAGEIPVLVTSASDEAATSIEGLRRGAEDFLSKTEPDMRFLRRATQLAIVRRDRALRMPRAPSVADPARRAAGSASDADDRRRHARYLLSKPVFATPVLPDGSPAATYSADGFSVDVSEGGLRFEIGNLQRLPTTHLLVGIEGLDTVLYFATVEARHVVPRGNGLDVGAQFAKGPRDLIRKENLEPTFNPATARYETGLSLDVIMRWVDFGIFRPALFDRMFVCPQCRAIPTFRNGCRVCGSVRLHSRPLIHHFACAHVGYVSDFENHGVIICPKCRTRNLIVGADFEHLNGPYHCLDCDWSDTELDTVGQCMKCELRFPMAQAIEEDLIGYHVNRLDPLAFINAN